MAMAVVVREHCARSLDAACAAQTKAGFVVMNGAVQFQESPLEVLSAHGIEPR